MRRGKRFESARRLLVSLVLLANDAENRGEEHRQAVRIRGLKRSSTFRNYTQSELRFRALLTEDGTQQIDLARAWGKV